MVTRKIIDLKQNGEKVWLKGHAQATYMSDGRTVEEAVNAASNGGNNIDLSGYATKEELSNKVDKVDGKQLSTEDFTTLLKQKLDSLSNYDDTEIQSAVSKLRTDLDTLVSGDTTTAIKTFNEVIAFLDGLEDTEDLASIIASIEQQIAAKYSKPSGGIPKSDLESAVQTSLSKADTALQEHQSLDGYVKDADLATVATSGSYSDLSNKPTIPDALADLTADSTHRTVTDAEKTAWNNKSDFSGNYNDLTNKPTIPSALSALTDDASHRTVTDTEKAAWNAKSDFSGSYNDLTNKPTIPSAVTVDSALSSTSTNPVQNKVINSALSGKQATISDLSTIRSGASAGATAVQPSDLADVATSGSFNDLSDKPAIPSAVTESTVSGWGFTKNTGTYSKPSTGIPKSDLADAVQTSLGKADTALQSYTEQYKGTITGITMNGASKGTSGVVNLGTVITAHQDISGKQDKLVSGTNIKTINGTSLLGSGNIVISGGGGGGGSSAYSEVSHGTSDTTFTLTPNTFHVWDEVTSLTLTLGDETAGVANEYLFQFNSGSTATTLTLPDTIKWANDLAPTISENMIYQISVLKGLASVLEFKVSIFPMYITTEDNIWRNADEQSIALADYILANWTTDGTMNSCDIPESSLYIDGHEVASFENGGNLNNGFKWWFVDEYDYDYFVYESILYVLGEDKGKMKRYDDD